MRLRPAVNMFIHLVKIGYARNVDIGSALDPGRAEREG
jgi:hypothetical protein